MEEINNNSVNEKGIIDHDSWIGIDNFSYSILVRHHNPT
jgi:hypothetical protein